MRPKLAIFRLSQMEIIYIHLNRYFPSETDGNGPKTLFSIWLRWCHLSNL